MFEKIETTYVIETKNKELKAIIGYEIGLNLKYLPEHTKTITAKPNTNYRRIAKEEYNNSNLWYEIANQNMFPFFPMDLQGGEKLNVPI